MSLTVVAIVLGLYRNRGAGDAVPARGASGARGTAGSRLADRVSRAREELSARRRRPANAVHSGLWTGLPITANYPLIAGSVTGRSRRSTG